MKRSSYNSRLTRMLLGIGALLLISGCAQGSDPSGGGTSGENFTAPIPITALDHLCDGGDLTAVIIVDGGSPIPMAVDCAAGVVTGSVPDLTEGSHKFVIEYSINGILVARAESTVDIVADQDNPVAFTPDSLEFPDDDGDGWTNLAEIKNGTDHLLASSRPAFELPRSSANYVLVDLVGISPAVGVSTSTDYSESAAMPELVGQTATSTSYTLR